MKSKIKFATTLLLAMSISLFFSCKQKAAEPFKLGLVTWVGFGPFYVAQEMGFFSDLNVDIQRIEQVGALRAALASGALDGIVHTIDSWANAAAEGLDAVCVLKVDESYGGDGLAVRKEYSSIKDLKGKTVAFPRGLPSHFFLLQLLKENGLQPSDIKEQHMEAPDAAAAFIANKVDAAVTWEPFLTEAGNVEHGKVLIRSNDYPGLIVDNLLINSSTAKNRPKDVERLLKGWFKAIDYVNSNPEEASRIMEEKFGLETIEIEGMLSGLRFTSLEENIEAFSSDGDIAPIVQTFNDAGYVYQQTGLIENAVTGAKYFNGTFLMAIQIDQ
ncbi:ABC transporter substrate-binding protein [Candidatus Neomarinimicrobiota bacterium]